VKKVRRVIVALALVTTMTGFGISLAASTSGASPALRSAPGKISPDVPCGGAAHCGGGGTALPTPGCPGTTFWWGVICGAFG
jgi:hypothetical protein